MKSLKLSLLLFIFVALFPTLTQAKPFDSAWKLNVYERKPSGDVVLLGQTPTPDKRGVEIPKGALWYIEPIQNQSLSSKELEALVREIKSQGVVGLSLRNAFRLTDESLSSLSGLSQLKFLDLH